MKRFTVLKNHDWILSIAIFLLQIIGLVVIYSSTFNAESEVEGAGTVNRQLIFFLIGFIIYFLVSFINPVYFKYPQILAVIYAITALALIYLLIFGEPVRNTNRWIELGFFRIQPSEFTKITLILINSAILSKILPKSMMLKGKKSLSRIHIKGKQFFKGVISGGALSYRYLFATIISTSCILLVLFEPALGNAVIIGLICLSLFAITFPHQKVLLAVIFLFLIIVNLFTKTIDYSFLYDALGVSLFIKGFDVLLFVTTIALMFIIVRSVNLRFIILAITVITAIAAVVSVSLAWRYVLKDYQKARIESFLNPEANPMGTGWQLRQSRIAIGSGRLFGKGFLQGSQSKLRYLPEAYSDFAFAAYAEEFGMLGSVFLISLYILLLSRIITAARNASSTFETLVCFGVAIMILVHVFVNISMNIGILPVTGIPLPLVSYGGSSIMITMIGLGLVQSINVHRGFIDNSESLMITSKSSWDMDYS